MFERVEQDHLEGEADEQPRISPPRRQRAIERDPPDQRAQQSGKR